MPIRAPRIVIAPDKFRGSLTASQAADIIAEGILSVIPAADCIVKPVADGGDGTVDAAVAAGADRRCTTVLGPVGEQVTASWALTANRTAVVETAQASGLDLIDVPSARTAELASSYGTGELIGAALDAGATTIIVGLGGSSMTDGGAGALTALGLRIGDAHGRPLDPGGAALRDVTSIDASHLDPRLATVDLRLATDVTNPLLGPNGAARVFGPQKGATDQEIVQRLDDSLVRWSQVLAARYGSDPTHPGAGAAGGLAFGLSSFVPQAQRRNGFHEIADMIGLDESLIGADAVVTGEGSMDEQSLWGKAPIGVLDRARHRGLAVYVLAGRISVRDRLRARGVTEALALQDQAASREDSIRRAPELLRAAAATIGQLLSGRTVAWSGR